MAFTLRKQKGKPLTHDEMDNNFVTLQEKDKQIDVNTQNITSNDTDIDALRSRIKHLEKSSSTPSNDDEAKLKSLLGLFKGVTPVTHVFHFRDLSLIDLTNIISEITYIDFNVFFKLGDLLSSNPRHFSAIRFATDFEFLKSQSMLSREPNFTLDPVFFTRSNRYFLSIPSFSNYEAILVLNVYNLDYSKINSLATSSHPHVTYSNIFQNHSFTLNNVIYTFSCFVR